MHFEIISGPHMKPKPVPLARILRDFENHEFYLRNAMRQVGLDVRLNRWYASKMARSYRRLRLYLEAASAPEEGERLDDGAESSR
jgi:hypothetical protein